jgi:hypothetical protein
MQKDYFDYIVAIATMLAGIGTFGAFVFLFIRDKDKQKQIDSLTALAKVAEEELMLSVWPDLYKNGAGVKPNEGLITIDLLNRGENARLIEFISTSPDIILLDNSLPWVLEKNTERLILARSTGKNPNDCEYSIDIVYEDKLANRYKLKVSGKGTAVNFDQPILVKHRYR